MFLVVVDGENLPAAGALDDPSGLAKAPLESTVGYVRTSGAVTYAGTATGTGIGAVVPLLVT